MTSSLTVAAPAAAAHVSARALVLKTLAVIYSLFVQGQFKIKHILQPTRLFQGQIHGSGAHQQQTRALLLPGAAALQQAHNHFICVLRHARTVGD